MNFSDSIKLLLKDSRLVQKAGIIFGLFVISEIFSLVVNLATNITSIIPLPEDYDGLLSLITICISMLVPFITFPIWMYCQGYAFQVANSIRKDRNSAKLPEHNSWRHTFKIGTIYLSLKLIFTLPFLLIISLFILGPVIAASIGALPVPASEAFFVLAAVMGVCVVILLSMAVLFVFSTFVIPAMMYIYIHTGSAAKAFSIGIVKKVLAESWLSWLEFLGIVFLLTITAYVLKFFLCCIPIFAAAALDSMVLLATGAMLGTVYIKLDQRLDLK